MKSSRTEEANTKAASAAIAGGVPHEKFVYTYDHRDRKVRAYKYVDIGDGVLVLYSINKRYYDNWNLIYETTEYAQASIAVNGIQKPMDVKKYYYGMDLEKNLHGSGGTGGLRMVEINGVVAFGFNDNMGNVEGLYSSDTSASDANGASSPLTLAVYEYSSYGTLIKSSGSLAALNQLRFSTRYYEIGSNLYYYGYRHYSPELMKWLSKDFIAETGGSNLYAFCINNPINLWDRWGLCSIYYLKNLLLEMIRENLKIGVDINFNDKYGDLSITPCLTIKVWDIVVQGKNAIDRNGNVTNPVLKVGYNLSDNFNVNIRYSPTPNGGTNLFLGGSVDF